MANAWSKAEEWEQKMDEKVNKVLDEVMNLDGVSQALWSFGSNNDSYGRGSQALYLL